MLFVCSYYVKQDYRLINPGIFGSVQYFSSFAQMRAGLEEEAGDQRVDGILAAWMTVDRVVAQRKTGAGVELLVKWCELGYDEASWERAEDLKGPEAAAAIAAFRRREPISDAARRARAKVSLLFQHLLWFQGVSTVPVSPNVVVRPFWGCRC